ncbi:MAG: DUF302 domain-containing protein [Gammaproteobacteria bacterium]|nr:DUF302 domain-containing protein [Gammaproteobacteria bacterium]NNJ98355.1 DUF302 domain-containing protein [Gammaproteobacteria bacterium]
MKIIVAFIIGIAAGIGVLFIPSVHQMLGQSIGSYMLIEVESPLGFDETMIKLEENAKYAGWKVPSKWKVNFQKNLMKVTGTDIGKNKVLKMCEPAAAAKMLVHDEYKLLTTMMPCTIAVYEKSDGKTYISLMNMEMLGMIYGGLIKEIADELAPQMMEMVDLSN